MIKIYGIKNCDTVKKAIKWLEAEGMAYRFHDFRKEGLNAEMIARFEEALGWEALLNRRGTTWRKLSEDDKVDLNADKAKLLMAAHDAIIKRPVWEKADEYRVGFAAKELDALEAWLKG